MTRFIANGLTCGGVGLIMLLAACVPDNPISPEQHSSRLTPDAASAAAVPDTSAGDYAYVYADQPMMDYYAPTMTRRYSTNPSSISIHRIDQGYYVVYLASQKSWPDPLGFAVSAVGSSPGRCGFAGSGHSSESSDPTYPFVLYVLVRCVAGGGWASPVDSRFTLLVVRPRSMSGRQAYTIARLGESPPNPLRAFTTWPSTSWDMSITWGTDLGDYMVDFATGATAGTTVLVSDFIWPPPLTNGVCKVGAWATSAVRIVCLGGDGEPADMLAVALQLERGRAGRQMGFAFAHQPTAASYAPNAAHSYNSSGDNITVARTSPGQYTVLFAGLHQTWLESMTAFVSPFGTTPTRCNVVTWGQMDSGLQVRVACFDLSGFASDSKFNVVVIQ